MSKFLWNVLKISGGQLPQMPPPGWAPGGQYMNKSLHWNNVCLFMPTKA